MRSEGGAQHALRRFPVPGQLGAADSSALGDVLRRRRDKLRVGVFIPLSGPAGIWGPSAQNSAALAATEINARGGILGREIELVVADAGREPGEVAQVAADLVAAEDIDVIIGGHLSAVRVAMRRVVGGRLPYVYTTLYEGGESTPGVMAIGETPSQQLRPAIHWLAQRRRVKRWYLIGSDYVWPWQSHRSIKRYISSAGGHVVGEDFVPLGNYEHEEYLRRIRAARPDAVLVSLIGTDSVVFNRAFAECGMARHMLRLSAAIDENALLGIGADNTENLYAASGYFNAASVPETQSFQQRYDKAFGACAPVISAIAQSTYEGFHFYAAVARRAGSLHTHSLTAAADGLTYSAARGPVTMRRNRAKMPIYLADTDGMDFRIVGKF